MRQSELTGKRVVIIRMEDPYTELRPGSKGTIKGEDDMGHILVQWDNGSSLNLIPDIDEYHIEESVKIRKFLEFVESDSYIDAKLEELEDMVKSFEINSDDDLEKLKEMGIEFNDDFKDELAVAYDDYSNFIRP